MKKILIILALLTTNVVFAQTPLNTAVDFTVTDIKGNQHNLFSYLNSGKYVCIDFFYIDCPTCQATAPYYQSTFEHFGCNSGNVIFISVSQADDQQALLNYANSHSYTYPMIPQGGSICSTYGIGYFPTYILIAPDKSIVEKDIWPVSSSQDLITPLTNHGGTPKACGSAGVIDENDIQVKVFPNPVVNMLTLENVGNYSSYVIFDVLGKISIQNEMYSNNPIIDCSALPEGVYFLQLRSNNQLLNVRVIKD